MSYAAYDSIDAVRWSTLKSMADSPLAYRHRLETPRADSAAMLFGRACHAAVLEPLALADSVTVFDGARRGGVWTEFAEANAGRDILTRPEWERVLAVQEAVTGHPVAAALLAGAGENELTVQWTDPDTSIACKARLDRLVTKPKPLIVDLKTTRSLDPRRWAGTVADLRYVSQLGLYRDGVGIARGLDCGAVIIAVESEAPHDVGVFRVTSADLWSGSDEAHALLERLAECEASGEWPGRYPERVELELPPWAYPSDDSDDELIASLKMKARA
jgi:hypothetical protein